MPGPAGEILISGEYVVTWNSVTIGMMQGDEGVPTIIQRQRSKPIAKTDRYGETKIGSIYLGKDYRAEMLCMEYRVGSISAFDPYGTAWGELGIIGINKYDGAMPLVFTVVSGVPAVGSPNTLTAAKAVIADDHEGKVQFGPDVRTVPLAFDLFPYLNVSSVLTAFVLA